MSSSDEQPVNETPGPLTDDQRADDAAWSDNPYLSDLLESSLFDLSGGEPVDRLLGSHQLRANTDGRTGQPVIEGYDNLGPSRTSRSQLRLNCGLSFHVGDVPTTTCDSSAIHVLDDALMFVGRGGNLGPTPLATGVSYALVAPPDLVVAIERQVIRNAADRRELAGFRVVLVNPVHREPLVIATSGLDQAGLAMLVTAGETFMREQVGSKSSWRSLGDEWETLEWDGAAAPVSSPDPAAGFAAPVVAAAAVVPAPVDTTPPAEITRPAETAPVASGPPPAPSLFSPKPTPAASTDASPPSVVAGTFPGRGAPELPSAATGASAQSFDDGWKPEPDSGPSRRPLALIAVLALAVAVIGAVAWVVLNSDDDSVAVAGTTADSTIVEQESATSQPEATAVTTTTTPPETTTTEPTTTTTTTAEPEPTTTVSTGPAPVSASQQLSAWGFTQPVKLDSPSGKAVCPAGEPTQKATVVGVGTALNVRDGADSSFAVLQRLALGYEEVDVFAEATTVSAKGTTWVTIAIAQPPGSDADRTCGWVAKSYLNYSGA